MFRKSHAGSSLPNPRMISMTVHKNKDVQSDMYTAMTSQWGEFIGNDLQLIAEAKISEDPRGIQ